MGKTNKQKAFKLYKKTIESIVRNVLVDEELFIQSKGGFVTMEVTEFMVNLHKLVQSIAPNVIDERHFVKVKQLATETSLKISSKIETFTPDDEFTNYLAIEVSKLALKMSKLAQE